MKKELDEKNFSSPPVTIGQAIGDGTFMQYLNNHGWSEGNGAQDSNWHWIRRHCVLDDWNYLTFSDLVKVAIDQFRQYYSSNPIPGSSSSCGVSIDGYNTFARWDRWEGGYVDSLGYVPAPTSSEIYGASLYKSSSWVAQGGESTPLYEVKFYALQERHLWRGGYVDGWGYVSNDRKILGATTSIWFSRGSMVDRVLTNFVNFNILEDSNTVDMNFLRERFAQYWNSEKQTYEIDDNALKQYLISHYYETTAPNIREGLQKHYCVWLRIVTRVDTSTGSERRYGNDFVILGYNALMRTYLYIDPVSGGLGSLDAVSIDNGSVPTVKFFFLRRRLP